MKKILMVLCFLSISTAAWSYVAAPKWSDYYPSMYSADISYWRNRQFAFENDISKCAFAQDEAELLYCYEFIKNKQNNLDKTLYIKQLQEELSSLETKKRELENKNRELNNRIYDYKYNNNNNNNGYYTRRYP